MSTSYATGFPSFKAAREILINRRVKIDADGSVTYADTDVKGQGTSINSAASGEYVTVQLHSQGIAVMTTGTATTLAAGAIAYAGASGLISTATANAVVGRLVTGAAANLAEVSVYAGA